MATTNKQTQNVSLDNVAASRAQLKSIKHEIKMLQSETKAIESRLHSWGLTIMETIGLAVDDVARDTHLYILPNSKLSRNDLLRKKSLLQDKVDQLTAELRASYAVHRQLQINDQLEQRRKQTEILRDKQTVWVKEFLDNPNAYVAANLMDSKEDWEQHREKIFASAERLAVICDHISASIDQNIIWQAWKIVAKARDLAADDYTKQILDRTDAVQHYELFLRNEKFATAARSYFNSFINLLPAGMRSLKILYENHEYDRVDYYIKQSFSIGSAQEQQQLEADLTAEINSACPVSADLNMDVDTADISQQMQEKFKKYMF